MASDTKTILVVDDDPEILVMLRFRLEKCGYRVLTANDGDEALEILEEAKEGLPDLMILDVMMPRKTGWEVARALKQNPKTEEIKVVMLTAIGAQMNEMTSPLYGADAHFDKPFEFSKLEATIKDLLS